MACLPQINSILLSADTHMEKEINGSAILNEASKAGLALGGVSVAYMFIVQLLSGLSSSAGVIFIVNVFSMALWAAKLYLCYWLMKYFMIKLTKDYTNVTNKDTFRLGMFIALCSALLYSAVHLANLTIISPDIFEAQLDAVTQSYAGMLDSNSMQVMENLTENFPSMSFFSNFIWCSLYGIILSAFLSKNIPARDPFEGFGSNNN